MKLFAIGDINYTPFHEEIEKLVLSEIYLTEDIALADVLVGKFLPDKSFFRGIKFRNKYGNKIPLLVWSCEPRDSPKTKPFIHKDILYPDIHVMNMYTDGVFRDSGSYYGSYAQPAKYMSQQELNDKTGIAVSMMTYVDSPKMFSIDGKNIDLNSTRQHLTILGHQRNIVEIYGAGWKDGLSKGSSGHRAGWTTEKVNIIQPYKFNICLENTAHPRYISEKIWQSVLGRCLPIYSSYNSSIYDIFIKNSFIDVEDFENPDDLLNYMEGMSDEEYLIRYNLCVDSMNKFCSNYDLDFEHRWIVEQILLKLKSIV